MRQTALLVGAIVLGSLCFGSSVTLRAQTTKDSLPPGVTAKMISDGAPLFQGAGLCTVCHGQDAKGMPNLGANLTDTKWLHSDGSYDGIVKTIMAGVPGDKSTTGATMPPKGGSSLTDAQVKAVAAYVWSLSHKH
jgi:mono/diheme cytochrome c family protein